MIKKIAPFKNLARLASSIKYAPKSRSGVTDKQIVIEELKEREIIKVQGCEASPFLQGLLTNDMKSILSGRISGHGFPSMYAMFLNKAGQMLYETIVYRTNDPTMFLIECDKAISPELRRHLEIYCVRRTIEIGPMDKFYKPWVIYDPEAFGGGSLTAKKLGEESIYAQDPRIRGLGWRLLTAPERSFGDIARAFAKPGEVGVLAPTRDSNYRYHRYRYGIGEGVHDFPPAKCLPLEINGDFLNCISFHKGWYIGQENTTRTYQTGNVRKRLMPLKLTATPDKGTIVQSDQCGNVGIVRGICNDRALALMRVKEVLKASKLLIDGEVCYAEKPRWWPMDLCIEAPASIPEKVSKKV